jgi:hypothetical protein
MSDVKLERTHKRARIYANIVICSLVFLVVGLWLFFLGFGPSSPASSPEHPPPERPWPDISPLVPIITVLISFFTLVASAIGATSTILLGWRAERPCGLDRRNQTFGGAALALEDAGRLAPDIPAPAWARLSSRSPRRAQYPAGPTPNRSPGTKTIMPRDGSRRQKDMESVLMPDAGRQRTFESSAQHTARSAFRALVRTPSFRPHGR